MRQVDVFYKLTFLQVDVLQVDFLQIDVFTNWRFYKSLTAPVLPDSACAPDKIANVNFFLSEKSFIKLTLLNMFYPKNVYILLLLFYYYVGRSDTLKHHDEVECNPSNKEVKGAKKLEQLLQKEKEDEDHRKESTLKDWAGDANKDFNLEIMKTFTTMSNADNPFCFKSYLTQNSYIDECQIADLEGHKTADSLLAAFTNGRLGNQVR